MITTLDLSVPAQLTLALVPDLVLMGGAMLILLWAAWRPDSDEHQRNVGIASIILAGITMVLVLNWVGRFDAGPGPIAVDAFRWLVDVVILLGTVFTIEGANMHEAYLVLREGRVVGFYLPGERAFSALEPPAPMTYKTIP